MYCIFYSLCQVFLFAEKSFLKLETNVTFVLNEIEIIVVSIKTYTK